MLATYVLEEHLQMKIQQTSQPFGLYEENHDILFH